MKRNRFSSRKRISADATELSRLAIGLAESGSKLEDQFWQGRLVELVNRLFQDGTEDDFTARWTACSTRIRWRMTISPTSSRRTPSPP
jgi:hypothetical protein